MLEPVANTLKTISRKEGELTSFLIYPLLIIVVYEVFMRYVFNAPTTWGFEATTFLYGLVLPIPTFMTPMSRWISLRRCCLKKNRPSSVSLPT